MTEILQQICGIALRDPSPGPLAYVLVAIAGIVLAVVCTYTVVCFIRPGEGGAEHIKHRVLHDDRF